MLTLDLALITHRPEGIERIADMNLPSVNGVRYVISWQNHGDAPIPESLLRNDIEIHRFDTPGLSRNRNNAIEHCSADIILISDDDLKYFPNTFSEIIKIFEERPHLDVATFKASMFGQPLYPSDELQLVEPLPKGYWPNSITIAFRCASVGNLRFHPEFGLGSRRFHGAEDELFLLSAIRRGLNCRFFPIEICVHPASSTGTKDKFSSENLRAIGCYITIAYPKSFIPRLLIKAWRVSRKKQSGFLRALRFITSGAIEAPKILKGDRRYLW